MGKQQQQTRPAAVDFATGASSRVIFLTDGEFAKLVDAWKKRNRRYRVKHGLTSSEPPTRDWWLDLDPVCSIHWL